jgi:glycosyltransferase involved in cell wall biosynthesis
MKILYVTTVNIGENSGVRKKIYGQIKEMRKENLEVEILSPFDNHIGISKTEEEFTPLCKLKKGVLNYLDLSKKIYKYVYEYSVEGDFDAIFVRYSLSDWNFLKCLRRLHAKCIKIFIEIPTYPYDREYDSKVWFKRIGLYIDRMYRKRLHQYVDIIFTPSPKQKSIYGIKTIFFENGIDLDSVEKRNYKGRKENSLRFIAVANINPWHGYDRVIKGIAKYYKEGGNLDIVLNVVGEGPDLSNLISLTQDLQINDKVVFHHKKYGKDLDEIYNNSDIAISSIGFFRLDSIPRTILKTREACLKSIPFVSLKGDPTFDKDFKYAFMVEDKDEPVDIEAIVEWFSKLNTEEYIQSMYNFAVKNLGWNRTFKPVVEKIKKEIRND